MPYPTMPHRLHRLLMLWFVIALQALTPFVHAHAGAVPPNHTGWRHVPPGVHGDVTYHAIESGEQGEEIEVARGMPLRHGALAAVIADAPSPVPAVRPPAATAGGGDMALPVAPSLQPPPPDHALPHASGPPRR
ncbi:MAG: hypothetical protein HY018_08120 [Hydrogenophilales bacterium]|nr:hypothetical protein [Hydrogenophilales bacterium]